MRCRGVLLLWLLFGSEFNSLVAADSAGIQAAIEQGVQHLRQNQGADGTWASHPIGATALVGLALLECEVPPNDPAIQAAANHLRSVWPTINDHATYCLALTLLFLDRLGDPADVPIIQALAIRLMAGQNADAGWDYGCPQLTAPEVRSLQNMVKRQVDLKATEGAKLPQPSRLGERPVLPKELQQIIARMRQHAGPMPPPTNAGGDNSNTQFAVLALWAARRHGVPVDQALLRTAARFRGGQNPDGGWGYLSTASHRVPSQSTASMTCAGLLGLAIGYGTAREAVLQAQLDPRSAKTASAKAAPAPAKDPAIRAGVGLLTRVAGQPLDVTGPLSGSRGLGDLYYLLWSIERVAVAYDLPTVGRTDWYDWGSTLLLNNQLATGGWKGRFATPVDTSFALLFLKKANLSRDLTPYLKSAEPLVPELKANVGDLAGGPERPAEQAAPPKAAPVRAASPTKVEAERPAAPVPEPSTEPSRLAETLLKASGKPQAEALEQLKQGKGAAYTDALAGAIGRLSGETKAKARDALAERLARMTVATLRDKLRDGDTETRRAAALACGMKEEKQFVPDLIALLRDRETTVVRAAHAALKALTGQDFGPKNDWSADGARAAATAWDEWWKKQVGR